MSRRRLRLEISGLVQGVGFRPHCHRLATALELGGWVSNGPGGVTVEVEGEREALERFLAQLQRAPPAHSRLEAVQRRWQEPIEETVFSIRPSAPAMGSGNPVPPDRAPCQDCLAELSDPTNRRHGDPFISCCSCGPRSSLLLGLPFERERTTLAGFPPCAACRAEYTDPTSRRFHAQTIGCPACGPQLSWRGGAPLPPDLEGAGPLAQAVAALRSGRIVALKGLGGYQLLVEAGNEAAVQELRRRKGRPTKPLALLVADLKGARALAAINPAVEALLSSAAAPIVLLRRPPSTSQLAPLVAPSVAPGLDSLGVMLPATPLHHLLARACGAPLVATSGNRSGEPLCFDDDDALERLAPLADGFLVHNRPIALPFDDSVVQVVAGRPLVLRLARGLAPLAIDLSALLDEDVDLHGALALGAQLKSSLALGLGRLALLTPHLGELESEAGERRLRWSLGRWTELHGVQPSRLACDQHRGYVSSQLARELAEADAEAGRHLPLLAVQHHHAHLLAVMAEHGLAPPRLGVAWDGAGQGADGSLWGGELLRVTRDGFEHLARLRPFPLPGGERALREPRRAALGLLLAAYGPAGLERLGPSGPWGFSTEELNVLARAMGQGLNSPRCSSIGRLFDALSALLGLCPINRHEGEAAMALEAAAWRWHDVQPDQDSGFALRAGAPGEPLEIDWRPLLAGLLGERDRGTSAEALAHRFHIALASLLVELAQRLGARELLLAGGCFQNRLLLELASTALERAGIAPIRPERLPCNDGALAVGQLLALALQRGATVPAQAPGVPRKEPAPSGALDGRGEAPDVSGGAR
ncbi:carbamoyltransferase HypF [Cyanobium sp. Morenito 9A2]|uniref:carbamoyltransferase HypF n=1 Tax=Cyanobium sp. Morenito 9A2 TaxID=2823718 RepID=UPI0020CC7696|nr:carbamoyltransferase HypF [Cyanobium sp. Morenito 9A2]MCP9848833.1 carbamoyltransferase HypF [Cyanobium sp. Morenito 9A2]